MRLNDIGSDHAHQAIRLYSHTSGEGHCRSSSLISGVTESADCVDMFAATVCTTSVAQPRRATGKKRMSQWVTL